jgi:hypothetical protein
MPMRTRFLLTLALVISPIAQPVQARSINDIPAAKEALLRIVSPKFYRSLAVSPVQAWIVVRGHLVGNHVVGARVGRSELGGRYDRLALELAHNLQVVDLTRVDPSSTGRSVLVHLLVYQIADGTMAMSFAHLEGAGGNQFRYSGAAWMAVLKGDKWVTIEPQQLAPNERRGPRMYTLAVEPPASARSLQGNGRPPITIMSIQGAGVSSNHSIKDR